MFIDSDVHEADSFSLNSLYSPEIRFASVGQKEAILDRNSRHWNPERPNYTRSERNNRARLKGVQEPKQMYLIWFGFWAQLEMEQATNR